MLNSKQYESAKSLINVELNDYEYFDHIVIENDTYFFQVIHLNGNQRKVKVLDVLNGIF